MVELLITVSQPLAASPGLENLLKEHYEMPLAPDFGITLDAEQFEGRFLTLSKQLFASTEYAFDDVCTHVFAPQPGMAQFDHFFIRDDRSQLHLYYGTGDQRLQPAWHERVRARDWEGACAVACEPGNGHAVGKTLFDLKFKEHVFFPPQGRFDLASRCVCSLFRFGKKYGMLYDVRGGDQQNDVFIGMSLAWSDDLDRWELGPSNPVLAPPAWACKGSTCKDPHVMLFDGVYLIYYVVMDREGYCCIALATTDDWHNFCDEGCVFRAAPALRGTMGIESPCVVRRNDLWHLFFTYGPGVWHAIGRGPRSFVGKRDTPLGVGTGSYCIGPFHATEILEDDGQWWMTTDRKEETRRLNRLAGRLCYRGTYEDEKTLEEGMYLSQLVWNGDQPTLRRPVSDESRT